MAALLNNHHRDTVEKIFSRPTSSATPDQRSRDHGDGQWGEPN
jgi:hypothetical protein